MKFCQSILSKSLISALFLSASMTSVTAHAEGLYFGGAVGSSSSDLDFGDMSDLGEGILEVSVIDQKDSDTSYNFFIGYDLTDYVGLELGYVNLGQVGVGLAFEESPLLSDVIDVVGSGDTYLELSGITAAVKGQLPITEDLSIFAKLGTIQATMDVTYQLNMNMTSLEGFGNETFSESDSSSEDDDAQFYSLGASYLVGDFKLFAEYQVYDFEEAFNNAQVGIILEF